MPQLFWLGPVHEIEYTTPLFLFSEPYTTICEGGWVEDCGLRVVSRQMGGRKCGNYNPGVVGSAERLVALGCVCSALDYRVCGCYHVLE